MSVDVYEAGGQASVVSIDNLPGSRGTIDRTDIGYSPTLNANVRTKPGVSSAVDHAGVSYQKIEYRPACLVKQYSSGI